MVTSPAPEIAPDGLVRPFWQRTRYWLALAGFVIVGAVLVATLSDHPGRPLDPASAHKDGSKALARLLHDYGTPVLTTTSLDTAMQGGTGPATVVVTAPDDYSSDQLRRLAGVAARVVLVRPDTRAVAAASPQITPKADPAFVTFPDCAEPGAAATGPISLPGDARAYDPGASGATSCFGGVLLVAPRLVILGSAEALQNDHLAEPGVAALDINAITDSRRVHSVVWLLPGGDTEGPGPASLWALFPDSAYRAFGWLIALGVLIVLWRARRLGGVVTEPLPVVVRSAELVEGHGRLYARAGARDRAAAALRHATSVRLAARLGLPRGAPADQVAVAVAPVVGRSPAETAGILAGPPPADDAALMRLAHDLDHLEAAASGARNERTHQ
ncbi:MAG: hypothetical protein QOG01_3195 [Pseudonocardiales bacterium]|nr:hypothetical protein [Pseudonocardiales bacterium]